MYSKEHFIRRCLALAAGSKGYTAPNPMVGAVLVHDGRIIGEGFHERYGAAHAEINCLQSVRDEDKHLISKSTMYVSLEPCAHYGHTPPCAIRLVKEKVQEVIVCNNDPFAQVDGKGFDILRQHHIRTESGILEASGLWVNRRFFCFHQQQRPYVILKWAQTQQGFFAPLNRTRYQMSNRHSQQLVHKWRTEEAAVLVGTQTALNDDPQLTARLWNGKQPLRIVIDKNLSLPKSLRIYNGDAATWIINASKQATEGNITYLQLDFQQDLLQQLLHKLHDEKVLSLIVEGGATLLTGFIEKGIWDEARVFETENVLKEGINAPLLKDTNHAFTSSIQTDRLHLYVNKNSAYQYVPDMEL